MESILGYPFEVYRAYQLPTFSESHRKSIEENIARYIYVKYTSTTSDLIPRYHSADDVIVSVNSGTFSINDISFSTLTIDHSVTQVVVFIQHHNYVTVLLHLPLPVFLVQMLESLDFDTPLILQAAAISVDVVANSVAPMIRTDTSLLGQINIRFSPRKKLQNDSLREIIVSIPRKDSKRILEGCIAPMDAVLAWMEKTTTLKLQYMETKSFECDIFHISGGKIAFKLEAVEKTVAAQLLDEICGALTG